VRPVISQFLPIPGTKTALQINNARRVIYRYLTVKLFALQAFLFLFAFEEPLFL